MTCRLARRHRLILHESNEGFCLLRSERYSYCTLKAANFIKFMVCVRTDRQNSALHIRLDLDAFSSLFYVLFFYTRNIRANSKHQPLTKIAI